MHFTLGKNRVDGIQRGVKAVAKVVVHAQVALGLAGILPGNAKYGVALIHEVLHQRVMRRQVEDVVLHDPGRNQQHRLGVHQAGGGRVLDQLHHAIAQHHLAGRDSDIAADREAGLRPGSSDGLLQILDQMLRATHEIGAEFLDRPAQRQRIGRQSVAGREHV